MESIRPTVGAIANRAGYEESGGAWVGVDDAPVRAHEMIGPLGDPEGWWQCDPGGGKGGGPGGDLRGAPIDEQQVRGGDATVGDAGGNAGRYRPMRAQVIRGVEVAKGLGALLARGDDAVDGHAASPGGGLTAQGGDVEAGDARWCGGERKEGDEIGKSGDGAFANRLAAAIGGGATAGAGKFRRRQAGDRLALVAIARRRFEILVGGGLLHRLGQPAGKPPAITTEEATQMLDLDGIGLLARRVLAREAGSETAADLAYEAGASEGATRGGDVDGTGAHAEVALGGAQHPLCLSGGAVGAVDLVVVADRFPAPTPVGDLKGRVGPSSQAQVGRAAPLAVGNVVARAQGGDQLPFALKRLGLARRALPLDTGDLRDVGDHAMIRRPRRPVGADAGA